MIGDALTVDSKRISPGSADQRRRAREQLKIPENAVAVATIGPMAWQEDPETAYAAMSPICRENPDVIATWHKTYRTGGQTPNHRAFTLQRLTPQRCYGAILDLYHGRQPARVSPLG